MKKLLLLFRAIPKIIDYIPAVCAILGMIQGKWYVKLLLFILFLIAAVYFCGAISDPYTVDPAHPIDTISRVTESLQDKAAEIFRGLQK